MLKYTRSQNISLIYKNELFFSIFPISTKRCVGFLLCNRSKSTIYWDNIARIWKYLVLCRWSKMKILPEQSHFLNGSPLQPSLHSQSGFPLTMPWSNCMHNNSWTFFTLQLAFSPQGSGGHSSFTSTGGSGGGGVLSVSVECFHWKFKNMIGVVRELNFIWKREKRQPEFRWLQAPKLWPTLS